jgi:hypothetical protein
VAVLSAGSGRRNGQGFEDPYGTVEQLERIERHAPRPVQRLVVDGGDSPRLEHTEAVVTSIAAFASPLL